MRRLVVVVAARPRQASLLATWGGARPPVRRARRPRARAAAAAAREHQEPAASSTSRSSATRRRSATSTCEDGTRASTSRSHVVSRRSRSASATARGSRCITDARLASPRSPRTRVDMVIATFTYTQDRDTRIDFSRAYFKAQGRLLVPNAAPNNYLSQLAGKTISTTTGSIYDRWMKNCFKDTRVIATDGFTNALLEFRNGSGGRAHVGRHRPRRRRRDGPEPSSSRATRSWPFRTASGSSRGTRRSSAGSTARLTVLKQRDAFNAILKDNVPAREFARFQRSILRPNNTFTYVQRDETTICP